MSFLLGGDLTAEEIGVMGGERNIPVGSEVRKREEAVLEEEVGRLTGFEVFGMVSFVSVGGVVGSRRPDILNVLYPFDLLKPSVLCRIRPFVS